MPLSIFLQLHLLNEAKACYRIFRRKINWGGQNSVQQLYIANPHESSECVFLAFLSDFPLDAFPRKQLPLRSQGRIACPSYLTCRSSKSVHVWTFSNFCGKLQILDPFEPIFDASNPDEKPDLHVINIYVIVHLKDAWSVATWSSIQRFRLDMTVVRTSLMV